MDTFIHYSGNYAEIGIIIQLINSELKNPENVSVQYLCVYCRLTLHHVIECIQKRSELSEQYRTHRCKQKVVVKKR